MFDLDNGAGWLDDTSTPPENRSGVARRVAALQRKRRRRLVMSGSGVAGLVIAVSVLLVLPVGNRTNDVLTGNPGVVDTPAATPTGSPFPGPTAAASSSTAPSREATPASSSGRGREGSPVARYKMVDDGYLSQPYPDCNALDGAFYKFLTGVLSAEQARASLRVDLRPELDGAVGPNITYEAYKGARTSNAVNDATHAVFWKACHF